MSIRWIWRWVRTPAGLVREIVPVGHIVRELVEEARQIISQRLAQLIAATQKEP